MLTLAMEFLSQTREGNLRMFSLWKWLHELAARRRRHYSLIVGTCNSLWYDWSQSRR